MARRFIRHARLLGFGIEEVRSLLALADQPQSDCQRADAIASRHLQTTRDKIDALVSLAGELERMVSACRRGESASCCVLETLSNHALCGAAH